MRWGQISAGILIGGALFLGGVLIGRQSVEPPFTKTAPAPKIESPVEAEESLAAELTRMRREVGEFASALEKERLLTAQLEWWIGHVAPHAIGCAMPLGPGAGGPFFIPSGRILGPSPTQGHYRITHDEADPGVGMDCVVVRDGRVIAALVVTHVMTDYAVARVEAQARETEIRKDDAVGFIR